MRSVPPRRLSALRQARFVFVSLAIISWLAFLMPVWAADDGAAGHNSAPKVFLRVQVVAPQGRSSGLTLVAKGHRHVGPNWYLPEKSIEIPGRGWSEWIDLSDWPWHGKMNRAGGI